jgi:hypothetical protein
VTRGGLGCSPLPNERNGLQMLTLQGADVCPATRQDVWSPGRIHAVSLRQRHLGPLHARATVEQASQGFGSVSSPRTSRVADVARGDRSGWERSNGSHPSIAVLRMPHAGRSGEEQQVPCGPVGRRTSGSSRRSSRRLADGPRRPATILRPLARQCSGRSWLPCGRRAPPPGQFS